MPSKNTEVEEIQPELPVELVRMLENPDSIATAEQLEALAAAMGIDDTDVISPWVQVKDKEELINRPFYIRRWKTLQSKDFIGNEFVVVFAVTYDGHMIVFSDGSAGIARQLKEVSTKRFKLGIYVDPDGGEFLRVPNGLRMSEYDVDRNGNVTRDASEKFSTGRTFYLG